MVTILKERSIAGGLALGTLNTQVAVAITTAHGSGLKRAFLMKHVTVDASLITSDEGDVIMIGIARGGASVTEIKSAMENADVDEDKKGQASVRDVAQETVHMLVNTGDTGQGHKVRIDVSLGGGKGIPFAEDEGWQWFAYNFGVDNQVAGAFVVLNGTVSGVWL